MSSQQQEDIDHADDLAQTPTPATQQSLYEEDLPSAPATPPAEDVPAAPMAPPTPRRADTADGPNVNGLGAAPHKKHPRQRKIAVLTSGGDSAGMNAAGEYSLLFSVVVAAQPWCKGVAAAAPKSLSAPRQDNSTMASVT